MAEQFYMEFDEGVHVNRTMLDRISIHVRGGGDPIEFHELPNESGRMYNLGPTLEERGWRLVSEVEYIAGRRVWALVERIEKPKSEPRFTVLNAGYVFVVRDAVTGLDVATSSSRSGCQHIADCLADGTMVLDSLGRAVAARKPVVEATSYDTAEHGVFENGECIEAGFHGDRGRVAAGTAAKAYADDPANDGLSYEVKELCADHAEQAKDSCEECFADC